MSRTLIFALCLLALASTASAQQPDDDPVAEAPIKIGVLALAPRFAITNLGVDTNVFNSVEDPQSDFTFTATPAIDLYMRTGRGLFSAKGTFDFVYFNEFDSERSVNQSGTFEYQFRFNRLRPFASFGGLNTRERPGYEIDVRARRYEKTFRVGADLRVASKSYVEFAARRQDVSYAGDEVFDGKPLNQSLNRTLEALDITWRQRLTSLTTWVVRGSAETERFEFETIRNADSTRVATGFELGRFALIRGTALVGYRRLVGADGGVVPEYSGLTADANVSYTAPSQTRLSGQVFRDIQYSYDTATPYYVQTGWTATLTQRITGRWDFQLLGGRDRLAYRTIVGSSRDRTDLVNRIGGGIGYQLNEDLRASFDVTSYQRQSELQSRDYKTLRAGVSVSYVF